MAHQDPNTQPAPAGDGQDMYKRTVMAAMTILYSDGTFEKVMEMLKAHPQDPVKAISNVATTIMLQLKKKMQNQVPPQVMQEALKEVVRLIAELATEHKLFQVDEAMIEQILQTVGQSVGPQQQEQPAAAPAQAQPQQQAGIIGNAQGA